MSKKEVIIYEGAMLTVTEKASEMIAKALQKQKSSMSIRIIKQTG